MSEVLFDLDDFTETRLVRHYQMYECGIHRQYAEWQEHLDDCWHGHCPSCGQVITGQFDMHTNHGDFQHPAWPEHLCSKQEILMNHCLAAVRSLDGEWGSPWTNCHARSHSGTHKAYGYSAKGMPPECAATEYVEKREWLTAHRVPAEQIAAPHTDEGRAVVEAVEPVVTEWIESGGAVA